MQHADEMIRFASIEGWTLYERTRRTSDQWRNYKLVGNGGDGTQKFNWWLGWNGERLSRGSDAVLLAKRHPAIMQWVIDILKAGDWPDLGALKAAMASAHPDRGGSSAAFIEARARYVAVRDRTRNTGRQ